MKINRRKSIHEKYNRRIVHLLFLFRKKEKAGCNIRPANQKINKNYLIFLAVSVLEALT